MSGEPVKCICEFDAVCNGSGVRKCLGCGGDSCVCAACWSAGEIDCDDMGGCEMCPRGEFDDDSADDGTGGCP